MANTPRLVMPEITASQSNKYIIHNDALRVLDAMCHTAVKDRVTAPSGGESEGDLYLIDSHLGAATGAFTGYEDYVAQYYNASYYFLAPFIGMNLTVEDENIPYQYYGAVSKWLSQRTVHDQIQSLTCADNVSINWGLGHVAKITLDRANTTFAFSGANNGERLILRITQDATGSRLVTFPGSVRYGTDIPSITLTVTGDKQDYIGFIYNEDATKYDVVSFIMGF